MTKSDLHNDHDYFREAIRFTSAETEFSERLIEKDYYCSIILDYLITSDETLIFKGGTCLNKIHAGFYRLSEDLDFSISMPVDSTRSERSRAVDKAKILIEKIGELDLTFRLRESLRGFNNSMQYSGTLTYTSSITGNEDTIKIEISLREPVVMPIVELPAATLLIDPFKNNPAVPFFVTKTLQINEAYAEKVRAALTRRDPAIRDFFDLEFATANRLVNFDDMDFLQLVQHKIAIPGNPPISLDESRLQSLREQLDARLRPVLRQRDFSNFDLESAIENVTGIANKISSF